MFKHILVILIIIVLLYFIVKGLNVFFHRIYISKNISKYTMTENDKCLLDMYSEDHDLESFKKLNKEFIVFYTSTPWNASTNNNYIYSKITDTYYIIDNLFYYYIDNFDNYDIVINSNKCIKVFNNLKKVNLI